MNGARLCFVTLLLYLRVKTLIILLLSLSMGFSPASVEQANVAVIDSVNTISTFSVQTPEDLLSSLREDVAKRRLVIIMLQSICTLLLIVVGVLIIHIQRTKLMNDMVIIDDVKEDLNRQLVYKAQVSKVIEDAVNRKIETLSQLSDAFFKMEDGYITYYENKNGRLSKDEIVSNFRRILGSLRDGNETIAVLEASLDLTENDLMKRVRSSFPELKELDYSILVLFFWGFSAKSVSFIMNMSEPAVRMRKTRYKQMFMSSDSSGSQEFLLKLTH